jgi:hypothetical protein
VGDARECIESTEQRERLGDLYPGRLALALIPVCQGEPHQHGSAPCANIGKQPLERAWNTAAAARFESDTGREQHLERVAHHLANGRNCGWAVPDGVLVLDADDANAVGWLDRALPDAPLQRTRAGAHFVVKAPDGLEIRAEVKIKIADTFECDLRVAGKSQIVVEPSTHASGFEYEWVRQLPENLDELPTCPPLIVQAIEKQGKQATAAVAGERPDIDARAYEPGKRNASLFALGCRLRRDGLDELEIRAALEGVNAVRCRPPLDDAEVAQAAASAARYEPRPGSGGNGGDSRRVEESTEPVFEPLAPLAPLALPEFPIEALGALADFTRDLAESMQVPADLAGPIVLGFAGGAVVRKAVVDLGSHREELALYVGAVAEPGTRKSSAMEKASAPIEERERWLFDHGKADRAEAEALARHISTRLAALDKRAAKAAGPDEQKALAREAATMTVEVEAAEAAARPPRLIASDTTPEKLAQMMHTAGERLLLASGEGAMIFDRLGRYSKDGQPNLDLLLSAWTGEPVRIDRVTGPPVRMARPCLGIVAALQPDVLRVLGKQASFAGRGLLDRFIWAVPPDVRGYRDARSSRSIDARREFEHRRIMQSLLEIENHPDRPILLRVEGDAREAWFDAADRFEIGQRDGGDLEDLRGWASKAAGQTARIAGVLALVRAADLGDEPEIDAQLVQDAASITEWASHHARRALGMVDGSAATGDAAVDRVVRWIRRRPEALDDFSKRELWQGVKGGRFRLASDLDGPLRRLEAAGWIARRPLPSDRAGRPSEVWAVNPEGVSDAK